MSDQWGQQPPQSGYGQQPYPQNHQGQQPAPTQPMGQYGQQQPYPQPQQQPYPYTQQYPQPYAQPYAQQQFAPAPQSPNSSKRPMIISGLVALVVIGGAMGVYFATQSGGSGGTVKVASTSGISPTITAKPAATATSSATGTQASPTSAATQASPLSTAGDSSLLTTNQVCPAFLELEQPLINQMGGINDEAEGLTVFGSFAPKFDALAAGTPSGQYQTEIQAVATDLDAIVAYIKANPHMSKPAPAAFDTLLDNFQNDADTVDNNCDPLG